MEDVEACVSNVNNILAYIKFSNAFFAPSQSIRKEHYEFISYTSSLLLVSLLDTLFTAINLKVLHIDHCKLKLEFPNDFKCQKKKVHKI